MSTWNISLTTVLRHQDARFELDVRFACERRRIVLFGPSGAGKTQTLKLIAGITRPQAGHVRIAGRTLYDHDQRIDLPSRQRRLGFVFQDYALFPHLTVSQNIAFARRRGWLNPGKKQRDEMAERWIRDFHLEAVATLYPAQLSGGQRQRTALARALVHEPAALLLDEPFAALDQRLRLRLRAELAELLDQVRLPMLLITHDEGDLRALADDVIHLHQGRVTHIDTPDHHGQHRTDHAPQSAPQ